MTDKHAFKKMCMENGVDVIPEYTEEEALSGQAEFPLFVKPVDSRGSRGQSVCYTTEQLENAINFAKSESSNGDILIEKYMKGAHEFQVTYFFVDGEAYLIRTVDSYCGSEANHLEKVVACAVSPSRFTDEYLKIAHQNVVKMFKAMRYKNGPIFMQGFEDNGKFRFFDPGLRFPGVDYERVYTKEFGIRLFEGIKYVLPILHPNKKRLALIMCPEEDSASVEWARQKDENWVNKDITSLEFVENIFRLMNWNRECRYKVLGRVANSDQGLCMLFDLEEAIMFTPKPQEYTDPLTGEMKKKQMKFFPDAYKNRIGKSYNDYIADHQMNMFEDFIGYQGSTVLDEPEREAGTTSIPIPQREESENIPLPDLPGQLENVQQSGNEIAERGMPT